MLSFTRGRVQYAAPSFTVIITLMLLSRHILALGFVPGMTGETLRRLIDTTLSFEELVTAPDDDLIRMKVKGKTLLSLREMSPYLAEADRQLGLAAEFGATIIHYRDENYPARLREIWSAPVTLYVLGELRPEDERNIGIVGTRRASMYGQGVAEKYAAAFARAGVTVTSGLARGIDTCAHNAAIRAGGRTIAAIASGLDSIQPSISATLAKKIGEHGAVITEHPFGVKAMPAFFPQRNRIISGISSGTVVVESDRKGGALITAGFAFDQNREVFAVPGPINSPKSNGTNELIRTDRARLTQSPEDVLDGLGYHIPIPATEAGASVPADLSLFEQKVYDLLNADPLHIDRLSDLADMTPGHLLSTLLTLELKGLARQMAGKLFVRE